MFFNCTATFTNGSGRYKADDAFYPTLTNYSICVFSPWYSSRIIVMKTHGYNNKPINASRIVYRNLQEFLMDWSSFDMEEC